MFVVVWQFEIAEEKVAAFEGRVRPGGRLGTTLPLLAQLSGNRIVARRLYSWGYLTIDRWTSEDDFRAFRKDPRRANTGPGPGVRRLNKSRETRVGAYTV